ncbi:MAG: glycosyltransferase [Clostridium sp.]|nr:glycosyltransferase [Prevotella sp.]MCM1429065.1 glycosyltransferase [Clostridium sp.]
MEITALQIVVISLMVALAISAIIGLRPWLIAARYSEAQSVREDSSEISPEDSSQTAPKISVVVYAHSDSNALEEYLESLITQVCQPFEVIVVYDASAAASAELAERFAERGNIYITFIPPGSHNLSRRKLANTIGIKASHGKIIVTTASNCRIPSPYWLASMTAPFYESPYIQVVLGYSHMDYSEFKGLSRYYREFDATVANASWLASAIRTKAWRGDGDNMAFTRDLFFSNKGYAKTINLHCGHDDIFVDEIAREGNTRVVLSPDSILTTYWGSSAARVWKDRKERRNFTRRWLPREPQLISGWMSFCGWFVAASMALSLFLASPSEWLAAGIAGLVLLIFWICEILAYRRLAAKIESSRLMLSIPFFLLWRPIGNMLFRLNHYNNRFKNFTWQRH